MPNPRPQNIRKRRVKLPTQAPNGSQKALPKPTGAGRKHVDSDENSKAPQEIINADLPLIVAPQRSAKAKVAQWAQMRALEPNLTNIEIAKRIGVNVNTLNTYIWLGTKEGWLQFEDPLANLEYQIIPKVVRNLNEFLDNKDRTVTIETAKGTVFKSYQDAKGITDASQTVLALKIEQPEGTEVKVITGHIVGKPKIPKAIEQ